MHNDASYGRPNPAVLYGRVEVLNIGASEEAINGKTAYEFYTAKDFPFSNNPPNSADPNEDLSGIYGKPKRTTYYEITSTGSGFPFFRKVKVEEPEYAFSTELGGHGRVFNHLSGRGWGSSNTEVEMLDETAAPLGLVQQKYVYSNESESISDVRVERVCPNVFGVSSSSKEYVYDGATNVASDSIESRARTVGWDARTGRPLITAAEAADDAVLLTRSTPAYWFYDGLKVRHMLTQEGQQTVYRTDGFDLDNTASINSYHFHEHEADVLSSTLTTWAPEVVQDASAQTVELWRKNDTYAYDPSFDFEAFPASYLDIDLSEADYPTPTVARPWEMTSNVTAYDRFSRAVESVSRSGNYSATLYGYRESYPVAIASPARRSELFYLDFEGGSGVPSYMGPPGSGRTGVAATRAVHIGWGDMYAFELEPGIKYSVSYWAKKGTAPLSERVRLAFNQLSGQTWVTAGNVEAYLSTDDEWELVEGTITPTSPSLRMYVVAGGGNGPSSGLYHFVDGIRIHPIEARMSTYAYDALTGQVTAITDANNVSSFFEYDAAGRLVRVRDQEGRLVQRHRYMTADFLWDALEAKTNQPITFEAIPVEGVTYEWTVGGALLSSTGSSISRVFDSAGFHSIRLRLFDEAGRLVAEREKEVQIIQS